jgi:hypothetical protein
VASFGLEDISTPLRARLMGVGAATPRLAVSFASLLRMLVIRCRQGARMALVFPSPKAILTSMLAHSDHPVSVG